MISYIVLGLGLAAVGYFLYITFFDQSEEEFDDDEENKKKPQVFIDSAQMKYGPVNIYFASQTGTAEGFSESIREEAAQHSILCNVVNVKDFDEEEFKKDQTSIFVVATHYEGEPPDDAVEWHEWMQSQKANTSFFNSEHKYAVYGLGDLTYKFFCKMGKDTDEVLQSMGSQRIYEMGEGSNDQNAIEDHFEEWKINLWNALKGNVPENPDYDANAAPTQNAGKGLKYAVELLESGEETQLDGLQPEGFDLNTGKYIKARFGKVLAIQELRQKPSDLDSTIEIELEYPCAREYQTAGNLYVYPENTQANVDKALEIVGISGDQLLKVSSTQFNNRGKMPCPEVITADNLFKRFVDLQGYLKKSVLKRLLNHIKDEDTKQQLEEIVNTKEKLTEMTKNHLGLIDVLANFGVKLTIEEFLDISTRIVPRLYTIASSGAVNPKVVRLVVALEYNVINGVNKVGLASLYFKDLEKRLRRGESDLQMRVSYQPSSFYLPKQADTPCLFIATGAGYAPFRGMTEEREHALDNGTETTIGKSILFFGCRHRDGDYLYKDRIMNMNSKGVYSAIFEAFSRDDPNQKVYVQNILEHKQDMISKLLFKDNGNVYVCGNIGMSNAVTEVFKRMIADIQQITDEEASAAYEKLVLEHRINVEAWG